MLTRMALTTLLALSAHAVAQTSPPHAPEPKATAPSPAPKPRAELLSPGAEPRAPLRYTLAPESRWTIRPATKVTPISEVDGAPSPAPDAPSMIRPFDLTLEGSPDPAAGQGFSLFVAPQEPVVGNDGSPELRALVQSQRLALAPPVRVRLSDRGLVLSKQSPTKSAGVTPTEAQLGILDGLVIPFPDEPVGIGASWRINRTEGMRGYLGRHGLEATLVTRTGSRATVKLSYSRLFRNADDDALAKVKKQLPGATIESSSRVVDIAGQFEIDLSCPVPVSGSMLSKERDEIRLRTQGQQRRMIVGTDTRLTLELAR